MPPRDESIARNDRILLTDREWQANCEAVADMQASIERIEREILVFKTKVAMIMAAVGAVSSIATTIVFKLLLKS